MKKNTHPPCYSITASCSCGNILHIKSTLKNNITLDLCDVCHPFYTGAQRIIDTRGRVNLFNKRFQNTVDSMFSSKSNVD